MHTEERIKKLLCASPSQLATVDAALANTEPPPPCYRLMTFGEVARQLSVSRTTIWRMVRDGRLPTVQVRENCYRVPEKALRELVGV